MIKNEEMKKLCIAGELSNKELAEHFGVTTTEIYAWRSNHNLTIPKCAAIWAGEINVGKRTANEITAEIRKVTRARNDAVRKVDRADNRLMVLQKELKEARYGKTLH